MLFASLNLGRHLFASRTLLARRPAQGALAVAVIATLLSVTLAPDASPSAWDWTRIALIGAFGAGAVLLFAMAQAPDVDDVDRQQRLVITGALVAISIVLNLTFNLGATVVFSIGITVVALVSGVDRNLRSSRLVAAVLIAAIPLWVWSALQAWTWRLLLLLPLAAIATVTHGHMRSATRSTPRLDSLLSIRAHRLGSWAGILGSGLLALLVGTLTSAANGVVALGAIGAMALVALEAGTSGGSGCGARWSVAIVDIALCWIALCWIVSL